MQNFYRITYRNTKGKPGFVTVPEAAVKITVQRLTGKGYTMVTVNPGPIVKRAK